MVQPDDDFSDIWSLGREWALDRVNAARISGRKKDRSSFAAGAFTMFRIISPDGDCLALSETVQGVVNFVRLGRPGRYQVDEAGTNTQSSGSTSRNWGAVIRFPSGDISIHNHSGPG